MNLMPKTIPRERLRPEFLKILNYKDPVTEESTCAHFYVLPRELDQLASKARRNKTRTAKAGPIKVKVFRGRT